MFDAFTALHNLLICAAEILVQIVRRQRPSLRDQILID